MWFKNLKLYRLAPEIELNSNILAQSLEKTIFKPGGSQDSQVSGWLEPRDDSGLVYNTNQQLLLRLHTEKKLLPNTVINQAAKAHAMKIEEQQGFKPGRKQMKEIKEQMTMELLPKAFVIAHDTYVWLDPINHWLAIDAAAVAKCDEVMGVLAKTLSPFPVQPLHVNMSPAAAMTQWLATDEAPAGFTIDQDTELKATNESRATVRYVRQSIDNEEVQKHIKAGKQCTRLALTWNDKISFVLTDNLDIKKLAPLDVIKDGQEAQADNEAELFEADFTLMTGEIANMLDDLMAALGGIKSA